MLWKYFFSSHFGLFHSKIDPWNTCLVSGTNKWLMRSNWVGTVHVSIVMFVSWAKTYCRTAVWSGTCNSRKSIWLKSWCVLKDELLWTHQNLKGRILHWLFWKNRWYWINFLIKQITSLKVRLDFEIHLLEILAVFLWVQVPSWVTVYVPEFGLFQQSLLRGQKRPFWSCVAHSWHFGTLFFLFIPNGLALLSRPW